MGGSNTSHPHQGDQLSFTCRLSTRKVVKFGEMLATMSTLTGTRPCPGASRTCTSLPPLHLIYSGETEAESHSIHPTPAYTARQRQHEYGGPRPTELSWPLWMRISHPRHSLLFRWEKGWRFPLVENALSPFQKRLLLGSLCAGIYGIHA